LERSGASLLPLLPKKEERAGERRPFFISFPSLQLSPRSFLAGREGNTPSAFFMPNNYWFPTRNRFAASKASELATVLPIGNRRYGRFGNPRYVQRALNRYSHPMGRDH